MGGGAWPFLVGGVICLVNSVNERDLNLLNMSLVDFCQNRWVSRGKFRWTPTHSSVDDYQDVLLRGTICIEADGSLRQ